MMNSTIHSLIGLLFFGGIAVALLSFFSGIGWGIYLLSAQWLGNFRATLSAIVITLSMLIGLWLMFAIYTATQDVDPLV